MKNPIQKMCRVGLFIVLLASLLTVSSLFAPGNAGAQVARTAISSAAAANASSGKLIVVSLSKQHLYAYHNGHQVFSTAVLTGQPALPTPLGTYHIFAKYSPITFHSRYPRKSRFWYPPTHINYALEWKAGGYFLHDSWWHTVYGAGTEYKHYDPTYGWQTGSHGCVSMPLSAARWIYHWAPIGTTVRIVR